MNLSITKYCSLQHKTFSLNGEIIFENKGINSDTEFLSALYREMKVGYPKFFKMDALSKTGFLAAELLLKNTEIYGETPKPHVGIFLSNRTSSLETDEDYQRTIGKEYFPSPSVFVYTLPNVVMGEIAIKHKIFGENTFFVGEKFDTKNIYHYIYQSFEENKVCKALVGWVDFYHNKACALLFLVENKPGQLVFNASNIEKLFEKIEF